MNENNTQIKNAIAYLSGVCDFAQTKDGHGFNKPDAFLGHALNFIAWDDEIQNAALAMLQKYRKQLDSAGVELPEIDDTNNNSSLVREYILEKTKADRQQDQQNRNSKAAEVDADNGILLIYFPGKPSQETRMAIKAIRGWRWNPDLPRMPWSVPLANFANLKKALPDATWTDAAMIATMEWPEEKVEKIETKNPVSITLRNGKLAIAFAYGCEGFETLLETVKGLSERKWNGTAKVWEVPIRLATDVLQAFPGAEHSQEIEVLGKNQATLKEKSNQAVSDFKVEGLPYPLMPFQAAGVEFVAMTGGRAMIADQMGLGKTIQALAYLKHDQTARPAIIIVPASLKINWKRETEKWLPEEKVEVLFGTKPYECKDTTIFIINYDIVTHWVDKLLEMKPAIIIADEAHFLKNKKSQRAEAVAKMAKKVSQVLLLTGTPVTNRPLDLYNLLKMVDPKNWDNFWNYAKRYCGAYNDGWGWNFSGATNLEELHEKIKTLVIRRTKDQVLQELPAKQRVPVALEISATERKLYQKAQAHCMSRLNEGEPGAHLAIIEELKQAAAQTKMKAAISWIENFLEGDEKLIVFATHIKIIDQLMEHFGNKAVRVTGGVSMKDRQEAVDKFQNDDDVRLFIGNIQAAGVGLTLTAASNVCFLEYPWTPADLVQAEDRAHRIGQKNSVTSFCLMAEETIDEDVVALLEEKSKIMDTIQDGTATGQTNINILSELIEMVRKEKA